MRLIPILVLAALTLLNLVRGSIHAFAPDGGAHSIAGLDLTTNAQTILSLFATLGLQQIVLGLFEGFVLIFRRDLLVIALGFQTAQTAAGVINLFYYRPLPVPVPGAPFNAAVLAVLVVTLIIAWATQKRAPSP